MEANLQGKKVAIVATDGFEQSELLEPKKALEQAGAKTFVISPKEGTIRAWNHTDWGETVKVDVPIDQADAQGFDALVLPGGVMSPDKLRTDKRVQDFVRNFFMQHKPVAAICHGPWTLINAGVVRGRRLTSYHTLRVDLENAGAEWVDEEVVVDNGLVTSRSPADLKAFNDKMIEEILEGIHEYQTV